MANSNQQETAPCALLRKLPIPFAPNPFSLGELGGKGGSNDRVRFYLYTAIHDISCFTLTR